jgi:hypothetical protein
MPVFSSLETDILNGLYTPIMNEYAAPLVNAVSPASIYAKVVASVQDLPHAYLMCCSLTPNTVGHSVVVHSLALAPQRMGFPATQWVNRVFGFVGEVLGPTTGAGLINTVEFPLDAFHLAGNGGAHHLNVPTAEILTAAFAADPDVATVGPFVANTPGTDTIRTRTCMFVPTKYVHIVLDRRLTPRQLWEQLVGAIIANGDAVACAPLIDWVRTCCTLQTDQPVPAVQRTYPTVPLADTELLNHRADVLRRDLPDRFAPRFPNGDAFQVAPAIDELTNQLRLNQADTLARAVRTTTPSTRWGEGIRPLFNIHQVHSAAELAPVWGAVASCPRRLERATLQSFATQTAFALGIQNSAPLITPTLATRITDLQFAPHDFDNLDDGVLLFSVASRNLADADAARLNAQHYDQMLEGSLGATLPNLIQFRETDRVSLPTTIAHVSVTLKQYRVLLHMLFTNTHPLTIEFDSFCTVWSLNEPLLSELSDPSQPIPALILRWLQLRLALWFSTQAHTEQVLPVPNLVELIQRIRLQEPWYPTIPARYLPRRTPPVPPPAARFPRVGPDPLIPVPVNPAPVNPALAAPGPRGRVPQNIIRNDTYDNRFAPFRALSIAISEVFRANRNVPPPLNDQEAAMCLSYHIRGSCYDICQRALDHRLQTPDEALRLHTWCVPCYANAQAATAART